jgi:hypothetical protein
MPHCGGEIEGVTISYNQENKAPHFEMNHDDAVCHFDLELAAVFLNMKLERLFKIFPKDRGASHRW